MKPFVFILLIGLAVHTFGQTLTQTIRGTVLDKETQTTLPGAIVICTKNNDTTIIAHTTTETEGTFRLTQIPIGRVDVIVKLTGYYPAVLKGIVLTSAKETVLTIELEEQITQTSEVIVEGNSKDQVNNEMALISTRTFSIDETSRYAGTRDDPARMASNFAGARGGDDSRNDLIIRGNSPLGVLWRYEGIDIPNPNHFALFGTTGGSVSMLNNRVLANSDFMTGAFTADYGNAIAAAFDVRMRNGNNEKYEFSGLIGVLGTELLAEGPFKKGKKSSFLVNYRYSTVQILEKLGIPFGVSGTPYYQDITFKLNMPTKKGVWTVFNLAGKSDITILESKRDTNDWTFGSTGRDRYFGSKMGVLGLSRLQHINEKTYLKCIAAISGSDMYSRHDTINPVDKKASPNYRNNFWQVKQDVHAFVHHKISAKHNIRVGIMTTIWRLHLVDSTYYGGTRNRFVTETNFQGVTGMQQSYIMLKSRLTEQITTSIGIHQQFFVFSKENVIEPRASAQWQFKPKHSIRVGYGLHHQIQPIYVYFQTNDAGEYVQKNLKMSRSHHVIAGYEWKINIASRLRIETYYQALSRIPVTDTSSSYSLLNLGANFRLVAPPTGLVNTGIGRNYGIEFTYERFFYKGYYLLGTLSVYRSEYQGSDKVWRHTAFDGTYISNVLAGKEWKVGKKKTTILGISGRVSVAGGMRYSPIDIEKSRLKREAVYIDELAYTLQFPMYRRVDIRLSVQKNTTKVTHKVSFDAANVFNFQNILTQSYDVTTDRIVYEYQLGFFPVLSYTIDF
ncbi:MAG: TonB-dependent receptor [Bacteroidia bacterium]|nr:TonB-dependent receptor [Bacteroidia bacterium]